MFLCRHAQGVRTELTTRCETLTAHLTQAQAHIADKEKSQVEVSEQHSSALMYDQEMIAALQGHLKVKDEVIQSHIEEISWLSQQMEQVAYRNPKP